MTSAAILLLLAVSSCTVPKRYQAGKPFIYKSSITLENNDLSVSGKQQLRDGLANQIDDSLKVRTVIAVRAIPPFFYNRLSKPAVFDSSYVGRSKTFMSALLNSQGYFNPQIRDTFSIDTVRDQQRVHVRFFVSPGNALRYDSIGYDLQNAELQELAIKNRHKSLLRKKDRYSIQNISNELDRLLNIYRDNGFYKIAKEDLYAEHDTVVSALIDPSLDPFEQFELLDSLSKKKREPTINVVIKQRVPKDSSHLNKYYLGNISVYPDRPIVPDSNAIVLDSVRIRGISLFPVSHRFKMPFVAKNVSLLPGNLYRQSDYFKTINTFTNLGAWSQVNVGLDERNDTSNLLDASVYLYPAKKQSLNIDFETSRNTLDVLTTGSLFGLGLNFGIRNRNGFKESILTTSNLRFGVELGPGIIQTLQASFAHNIYVPKFILPFKSAWINKLSTPRTIISFSTSYTNRRKFFEVGSVNLSWGYDANYKNHSFQYIPFNVEFNNLIGSTDSLNNVLMVFPSLRQNFNNDIIISQIFGYTTGKSIGRTNNFFRARLEESGAIFGLIKNLERGNLRRFLKLDLEYKYFINYSRSSWAFRASGGYGYVYGKRGNEPENNLPLVKAYFGGGPYSMRGWAIRRLGLGSAFQYDTVNRGAGTDRWGDFKLEGNIEYRFNIATVLGIKLKSALFTDIGNIWGKASDQNNNPMSNASFKLSRLYKDIAVGAGTSLRFDFDFFLIRLDWAYQIKNPSFAYEKDGWFHKLQIKEGQFQLGIGYPF